MDAKQSVFFQKVYNVMQEMEQYISDSDEYVAIMEAVIAEASHRKDVCIDSHIAFEVNGKTFKKFDEVISWAWKEHKIAYEPETDAPLSLAEQRKVCKDLDQMIKEG
jgi:glutamate mutase epsilon subunit